MQSVQYAGSVNRHCLFLCFKLFLNLTWDIKEKLIDIFTKTFSQSCACISVKLPALQVHFFLCSDLRHVLGFLFNETCKKY